MTKNVSEALSGEAEAVAPARPKAAVLVAEEIRRMIVIGKLKPGDRLQPENELRNRFAISRPTLREAMRLLESQSLISISRGKSGGAQVIEVDVTHIADQVGISLQIEGTSLEDVWDARLLLEPKAASLLAKNLTDEAIEALSNNIAAAKDASHGDLMRYADLSAEFSLLIIRHCGNKTLKLLGSLIYDIIRRQHEDITERTLTRASVGELRQASLLDRTKLLELFKQGNSADVEAFWHQHLERMRKLVLSAYKEPTTIDMLTDRRSDYRSVGSVKRLSRGKS